jgi:DNA-binding helix-hairpin-helix protein with protein kinase domain
VAGKPDLVAKLYHTRPPVEKAAKLVAMVRHAEPTLLSVAAWPVSPLHESRGGHLRGILLPRVEAHREVHQLYSPAHRKVHFPSADWSFLLHVARNCAAAFETVHERGHVIGDVNQGGVLVSARGTVHLIDCDSFQIMDQGRVFRCAVAVPHYTPPELVGVDFAKIDRTQNHDCFGLALLIFHLMFMGRHPFAGRFSGSGDMTIERAIAEGRFAFSRSAISYQMKPPPHSLELGVASEAVAKMFEAAFAKGVTKRPKAAEWRVAIDNLKQCLQRCGDDAAHIYPAALSRCPWCEVERRGGPAFFASSANGPDFDTGFDLVAVWNAIERVKVPNGKLQLPAPTKVFMPAPVPADAQPQKIGPLKKLPQEPRWNPTPLPPLPTYVPELNENAPPYGLKPLPAPPTPFVPESVPSDPLFLPEVYPALPPWKPVNWAAEATRQYKRSLDFTDYRTVKYLTLAFTPVVGVCTFFGPLVLIALLLWSAFAVTWWLLNRPRRLAYKHALRQARGRMAREAAERGRVVREHERLTRELRAREDERRARWTQQIAELRHARAELPSRNEAKRSQWEREVERVGKLRDEIEGENERRLAEWRAHVRAVESRRRAEWEQRIREVELEQARANEENARKREQWRLEMQEYRKTCTEIESHNAAVEAATQRRDKERSRRAERVRTIEEQLEAIRELCVADARSFQVEFGSTVQRLEQIRRDYLKLRDAFVDERNSFAKQQREHQFEEFLKGILIEDEKISGIGEARKATLAAYGVETAFDVREEELAIPGFGPSLRSELLAWRTKVEKRFRFNSSQLLTTSDLRALHMKYQPRRKGFQRALGGGAQELLDIKSRAEKCLAARRSEALRLLPDLWQAQADLRIITP